MHVAAKPLEARPVTVIRPRSGWPAPNLLQVWHAREVLLFLAWRDVQVRYKQTLLGVVWVGLQPLALMGVIALFYQQIVPTPPGGVAFPVFVFTALVAWQFFSTIVNQSSNSVIAHMEFVTKVYFPRLIIPLAPTLAALVDLGLELLIVFVLMALYGYFPTVRILALPLFLFLLLLFGLGMGFWFSALNVRFRDVRYMIPVIIQIGFFTTPVLFSGSHLSGGFKTIYSLNPLATIVEGVRWSLIGGIDGPDNRLVPAVAATIAVFVSGLYFFRRSEGAFADVL